jgi:hypothetical protein
MKTLIMVAMLALIAAPAFAEKPTLRGAEAPRATDLLRAEKLAEQAQKRLKLPAKRGGGWVHGGSGWGEERPREAPAPVFIDIHPGKKSRSGSAE